MPTVEIVFKGTGTTVQATYESLLKALGSRNAYTIAKQDDVKHTIVAIWKSPKIGWLDEVKFSVDEAPENSVKINSFSRSTNVCPGWCGCVPRFCCAWFSCFGDSNMNQKHIQEIVGDQGVKFAYDSHKTARGGVFIKQNE